MDEGLHQPSGDVGVDADQRVEAVAGAICATLEETVNAPGRRAIRAVLAMQDDASLLQGDVQKTFATSAVSIRRYRALMARLPTVDTGTVSASSAFASRAPNTSATLSSAAVASFVAARSSSTASSSAAAAMASTASRVGRITC